MTNKLDETAGAGAIGAASIAVNMGGPAAQAKQPKRFKDFLQAFPKAVNNKGGFKPVKPFKISINEAFDLQDVLSRLSGMTNKAGEAGLSRNNVTYGVEDDEGNIMKVTVPKDQAPEFEVYLAHQLGDMEQAALTGQTVQSVSMAELLFNLKDKFTIVDVDFPKIPTDVVYNADKASHDAPTATATPAGGANDTVTDDQVGGQDAAGGGLGGAPAGGLGDDLGGLGGEEDDLPPVNNRGGEINLDDVEAEDAGTDGAGLLGGGKGPGADEGEGGLDDVAPETDAEGVEDFAEPEGDEGSILDKVIGMLKAQAEAETAKANAEAEKYRADQAESSARAASATISQEEEIAKMELQMDREKEKEKKAKQLADIAKFRAQGASSPGLNEADMNETPQMIRRQMSMLPQQWAVSPDDSPQDANYKKQQRVNAMRELQARLRMAVTRENEARRLRAEGKSGNMDKNVQQMQANQAANQQAANQGVVGRV